MQNNLLLHQCLAWVKYMIKIPHKIHQIRQKGRMEKDKVPPVVKRKFIFPQSIQEFEKAKSVKQIQEILNQLAKRHQISISPSLFKFQTIEKSNQMKIIHGKCFQCSALLTFLRPPNEKYFKIKKVSPIHEHNFEYMPIFKEIIEEINKQFTIIERFKLRRFCEKNFHVTKQELLIIEHHLSSSVKKKTLAKYIETASKTNLVKIYPSASNPSLFIDPHTHQYRNPPKFIFLASKRMEALYLKFGKTTYLHAFTPLIMKDPDSEIQWHVIIFSTKNNHGNTVFLGFAASQSLKSLQIQVALKVFFNKFDAKLCETLVTDESNIFIEGVRQFRKNTDTGFKAEHLWDKGCFLREVIEEKRKIYKKLIEAETQIKFQSILNCNQIQNFMGDEIFRLQNFLRRSNKYCLSQIPGVFVGLGLSTTHYEDILNLISTHFDEEMELKAFIPSFFTFLQNSKVKKFEEKIGTSKGVTILEELDGQISEYAFQFLRSRIMEIGSCQIISHENKLVRFERNIVSIDRKQMKSEAMMMRGSKPHEKSLTWTAQKPRDNSSFQICLKCDCLLKERTGLPCAHIIRVCIHFCIPLCSQIDDLWFCRQTQNSSAEEP